MVRGNSILFLIGEEWGKLMFEWVGFLKVMCECSFMQVAGFLKYNIIYIKF